MNKKYIILTVTLLMAGLVLGLTADYWTKLVPECFIYKTTGFYCPGCGGTRAAVFLLKGRIFTSFKYNPGVIILAVIIGLGLVEKIFNKKILPRALAFWVVLIIVLFGYYILRNFTWSLSALQPEFQMWHLYFPQL